MSSSAITAPLYLDPTKAADGSAASPSFAFSNSTSTGVYRVSADTLGISTAGVQRVVVDANGNVGVGTASPVSLLNPAKSFAAAYTAPDYPVTITAQQGGAYFSQAGLQFRWKDTGNNAEWNLAGITGAVDGWTHPNAGGALVFYTKSFGAYASAFTERMRLDASGNLLVGTTSAGLSNSIGTTIESSGFNNARITVNHSSSGSSNDSNFLQFGYGGSLIGRIHQASTSSVSYITTSDYRLKENVQPIVAALSRVSALKPCTYKWKLDGSESEGFIAHELAEICPLAVAGEKDAVNEDGSVNPQGIDPSKLVALLTAAIQELSAKVDAQAAEIEALKAKP